MSAELLSTLLDILISVSSIAAGGWGVWLVVRKRFRKWWTPYRIGLRALVDLPELSSSISAIHKQVHPNGGGSLVDATSRIERDVSALKENVSLVEATIRAQGDASDIATFEADATGGNTNVNQAYARWLGVGKSELLGMGFINFVHREDRAKVRAERDLARQEHRIYEQRYRVVAADGEVITVDAHAAPIPDQPPAKRWIGTLRRVQ